MAIIKSECQTASFIFDSKRFIFHDFAAAAKNMFKT